MEGRWLSGRVGGWVSGWVNGWKGRWVDGWRHTNSPGRFHPNKAKCCAFNIASLLFLLLCDSLEGMPPQLFVLVDVQKSLTEGQQNSTIKTRVREECLSLYSKVRMDREKVGEKLCSTSTCSMPF